MSSPARVFQVATGNVGTGTVDEILAARPDCLTFHGVPALNAMQAVVDPPPGIVTSADLPLRAFAGRFAR
jgi:hypothetical protein